MKTKPIVCFLAGICLLAATQAFGQNSSPQFIPGTSHPVKAITQQKGIDVSYEQGYLGKTEAISIILKNTTDHLVTFSWILKDGQGKVVYSSKPMQILAGQVLDKDNNTINDNALFSFALDKGMNAKDYKVEIK